MPSSELARILCHTHVSSSPSRCSLGRAIARAAGVRTEHDSFGSLPSSDLRCLRQKSGLLSPPGLPKPGLSPGSAPYQAAYYVLLTPCEPVSHLQTRHAKPTAFTDSTDLFWSASWALGTQEQRGMRQRLPSRTPTVGGEACEVRDSGEP